MWQIIGKCVTPLFASLLNVDGCYYYTLSREVTTFFLFMTRAFATGVFQAVYVYTPEVYPTSIRASALGLHTTAARIGALLTPFNAQVIFAIRISLLQSIYVHL